MVAEVMGRYAGWIALFAGVAGSADVISIPEIPFEIDKVVDKINRRNARSRRFSIVCVAEGAKPVGGEERYVEEGGIKKLGGIGEWVAEQIRGQVENQVRTPTLGADDKAAYGGHMIDFNVRAERMGWLPSAPQLKTNPIQVAKDATAAGMDAKEYVVKALTDGTLQMSCEDPDAPQNWPRNLFVWRSNLLGSSGKGHEYFCKHLLGTENGVQGKDLGKDDAKPSEVKWHEQAPEGKLDLLVTLDFRMSTTCLYSDIVLPTASWYEKNDLNTSDMHPFIHPLSAAVDPVWQSRSDWEIYKGFAKAFSEVCVGHLGVEKEVVLTPLMHDTPAELAQPFDVQEWKKGHCELVPGKTAPQIAVVERDYPNVYKRFTALGPLMNKVGNGGKGIAWKTETEVTQLGQLNGLTDAAGTTQGMPRIVTDIDACEVILQLAPETNGHVAVKAWEALGKQTGRDHKHLALYREDEKIRFRDIQAQPRKIISSPTWSGIESETVSYNAGYTNVHELIPWRTLTGRQQFYQDHRWMIAFGEALSSYRPPVDLKTTAGIHNIRPNGHKEIQLNFITPHQKWGIQAPRSACSGMLDRAREGRFAYPAINVTSLTTANAVLKGLAESRSDGIIQVSTGGGAFASGHPRSRTWSWERSPSPNTCTGWPTATRSTWPCTPTTARRTSSTRLSFPWWRRPSGAGPPGMPNLFNSHMFDGSALPLKENLDIAVPLLERCQENEIDPRNRGRCGRRRRGRCQGRGLAPSSTPPPRTPWRSPAA